MAIAENRQRIMPMPEDRTPKRSQQLAYSEAVLLTNPINPDLKGEVDDKYQYSCENKDIKVHGWISFDPPVGFWQITPSDEFRTGGPVKQNLTSHVGPTTLAIFFSSHYAGSDLMPQFRNGEYWKKVFGPMFIYLNSPANGTDPKPFWEDAERQLTFRGYTDGKTLEINLHKKNGESAQSIHRYFKPRNKFMFERLICLATSEDQAYSIGLDVDNVSSKESQLNNQDSSFKSSSSYFTARNGGKPGFISFHGYHYLRRNEDGYTPPKETSYKKIYFAGPIVLVAFLVFPSLYLRKILSTFFEDSLLTDFLILFFTEALFYTGVAIFFLLVDFLWRPAQDKVPKNYYWSKIQHDLHVTSVLTLVLTLIIPLLTMGLVWPWTGPAALATLAPYFVGVVVQFSLEQYACHQKSPAWPVIPVIFQIYRLYQLNRAAQLAAALSFSVRCAEKTSYTVAISNSLGALLAVLQILGIICVWSLSSFLMRFLRPSDL
ncbi:hypothetical protein Cni_G27224 [Canna indica]|uniref:Uncharacterized protein n=1 Tax=Canna indica TaxID=4628 RepID=A0AAQ3L1C0_9LILI|nr:hypothetical protein Cni_G27224 [Canna indica]